MVMFATLMVFQRDLDAFAALVGQVRGTILRVTTGPTIWSHSSPLSCVTDAQLANEVLNQVLKHSIQQSRPTGARMSGAGMPSAHAQFVAFFAAYVIAYTCKRCVDVAPLRLEVPVAYARISSASC